jgi:hypothetical protein
MKKLLLFALTLCLLISCLASCAAFGDPEETTQESTENTFTHGELSITLPKGEGEGSYEMAVTDLSFEMPKMADDHQLDLWLEVTLSDGQTLSTCGGSWYYSNGDLVLAVG